MENPPRLPLILCVVVGIGALCAAQFGVVPEISQDAPSAYVRLAALVLALVAWHLRPARSWRWLTIAGVLCTVPNLISLLAGGYSEGGWHLVVNAVARPLLFVGLLGAATYVWCAGGRQAGAALVAAVLVVPPMSGLVLTNVSPDAQDAVVVAALVLVGLTVVTAGRAGFSPAEVAAPRWRVTVAGAAAWVATGIDHWWPAPPVAQIDLGDGIADFVAEMSRHYLYTGIALLAVGVVAGAVAGPRVLVTGLTGGLVLGSVSALITLTWIPARLIDLPMVLPLFLAAVVLAAGVLLARSRFRELLGAGLLGAAAVGLLLLYLGYDGDPTPEATPVLVVIPLVIVFIGCLPVFASLGSVLAPTGEAPAALAGVVTAIAGGTAGLANFASTDVVAGAGSGSPVLMVFLLVAAGLTVFGGRRWART